MIPTVALADMTASLPQIKHLQTCYQVLVKLCVESVLHMVNFGLPKRQPTGVHHFAAFDSAAGSQVHW